MAVTAVEKALWVMRRSANRRDTVVSLFPLLSARMTKGNNKIEHFCGFRAPVPHGFPLFPHGPGWA
jgi:hypothetical protein